MFHDKQIWGTRSRNTYFLNIHSCASFTKELKYGTGKRINGEVATGGKQLSTDDLVNIIIQIYLK